MSDFYLPKLPDLMITPSIEAALLEDLGRAGDITTESVIPAQAQAHVVLSVREPGVVSGLDFARIAFKLVDPELVFEAECADGEQVTRGKVLAHIRGSARSILTAERVALNFLCHLSGISTVTAEIARDIAHTKARISCTRKTTPGLRFAEKYAVRAGGGRNHRFGLDDAVLIKDNHIAIAGGVGLAIDRARAYIGHLVKIEVEVDTLEQLREALLHKPDVVLLDNMSLATLSEAVQMINGQAIAEASGRINKETARGIAETGVDLLSAGWLTHSAKILDIGLDFAG